MRRGGTHGVLLELNFDVSILKLYQEIHYWTKLHFDVPREAMELYNKKEDMRILRESVLLVIRDYNAIVDLLSPEERQLFRERIRFLDKKVQPGLVKLTWGSKGISEFYVADCREHARRLKTIVDNYLEADSMIKHVCNTMSNNLLVFINSKRVYRSTEFEQEQLAFRQEAVAKLHVLHKRVVDIMTKTFQVFKADGQSVLQSWQRYVLKIDEMIQASLHLCVKRSLSEMSFSINGDGKSQPNPLLRMNVVLEDGKVQFEPTYESRTNMVNNLSESLPAAVSELKRLPGLLKSGPVSQSSYSQVFETNFDINKLMDSIANGLVANYPHLQSYVATWKDNFHEIWELDKDKFIELYAGMKPQLSKFDADIARYSEVANNVHKEETIIAINFIMVDCSSLKFGIVEHCHIWQTKFSDLLFEQAANDIESLHAYMTTTSLALQEPPETLEAMCKSVDLLAATESTLKANESRIAPIHEQFKILEKYGVVVPEKYTLLLDTLGGEFLKFTETLVESEAMLKVSKKKFKGGLIKDTEDLTKRVAEVRASFLENGPFSGELDPEVALNKIKEVKTELSLIKDLERILKEGLRVFELSQTPYKEVLDTERELGFLEQLWQLGSEWQRLYEGWSLCQFNEIDTDKMEQEAQGQLKILVKVSREVKEKDWNVVTVYKARMEQFKRTMPLIQDLKVRH